MAYYSFSANFEGAEPLIAENRDGLTRSRHASSHATGPCLQNARKSGASLRCYLRAGSEIHWGISAKVSELFRQRQ
ncbi:uncharacterized protein CTRU02_207405 [Colletotrichum truncatum]|uniref:Uncharacterized protein n=1 Tax=Colletotrichum truncatum TaxID=5467 RepID=A0ACC3Z0R3_COLTU|nr:uncharacterized protein CTRU02_00963 [Colletotrichum truncatum]KAF6800558.1 hypothetical protein CTRU02_00963 [Colletotrichum truncatum]